MTTAQESQQSCMSVWTTTYRSALEHGYSKDEAAEIATAKEVVYKTKSNFWSNRMADGSRVCRRVVGCFCGGYNNGLPEARHPECEALSVVENNMIQFLKKEHPELSDKSDEEVYEIWTVEKLKKSKK